MILACFDFILGKVRVCGCDRGSISVGPHLCGADLKELSYLLLKKDSKFSMQNSDKRHICVPNAKSEFVQLSHLIDSELEASDN